ncbi:hypothetical protein FSP39_003933 [Pinctada imbricata]|uniref:DZIP3-like HEPN domain-containing protein n=1 Tax=Pinctada imbricata TaxID=66713 RepID=A0AA88YJP3_PINIB|nr:hypothetical protein FSP39_003933 [Pinctada imbricata]
MATSKYSSTEETTNASRVSRVLLDPCTDQLRDLLRHYVPPHTFPQVIQRYRLKLQNLTKPQIDLILPRSGHYTGIYSDFDISLLYTLLRNICNIPPHTKGWGKDPDPNDVSLSANIENIRITRNKAYGHVLSSSLSNSDFNDIWSTVRSSVVEIDTFLNNNKTYEKEVDFLRNETMDPEMAKQYEEKLYDQVKEDTETRKMITETTQMVKGENIFTFLYLLVIRLDIGNLVVKHVSLQNVAV